MVKKPHSALSLFLVLFYSNASANASQETIAALRTSSATGYQPTVRRAKESFYVKRHLYSCPNQPRQRYCSPADGLMHLQANSSTGLAVRSSLLPQLDRATSEAPFSGTTFCMYRHPKEEDGVITVLLLVH
jgi:hypothetical protein